MGKKLTAQERRFIEEYLIDLNTERAAIVAGYSESVAKSKAYQWVSNGKVKPHVFDAIQKAMDRRSKRTEITQEMVLAELARVGFSNMSHYAKWNPDGVTLTDSDALTDDAARCVAEVSQTVTAEGGTVKFKLHDKVAALEKIGRHLGMFKDKVELTGKDGAELAAPVIYLPANGRNDASS